MHLVCVESNVVETRVEVFLKKHSIEIDARKARRILKSSHLAYLVLREVIIAKSNGLDRRASYGRYR